MENHEINKLADLDRSESVKTSYRLKAGDLVAKPVDWNVPSFFPEGEGDHSLAAQIRFCQSHLENGAVMIGAFDHGRLVGTGVTTPEVRPGMAQLAYLHVSDGYHRQGVATRILQALIGWASARGARLIYVSATPSGSAVGFYISQGFAPAKERLPELFDLEPEDIHMVRRLLIVWLKRIEQPVRSESPFRGHKKTDLADPGLFFVVMG
jgi:GNAT superfamily N-acetyltransferase